MRAFFLLHLSFALLLPSSLAALDSQVFMLRDQALAELENEQPGNAEALYLQLIELAPKEALGHANLAIALLRQQKTDEAMLAIGRALELARADNRGQLLAIKAEIEQWSGRLDEALLTLEQAVAAAPTDLEILFAAHHLATTVGSEVGERVAFDALGRLARLRPENVVVLIKLGQHAIASGDRTVATGAFLRIGELSWQMDDLAQRAFEMVRTALEEDDLSKARVPAMRLENVLKVSAMGRESLRELKTGIQGIPVQRFSGEVPASGFGASIDVTWETLALDSQTNEAVTSITVGDFDGDTRPDIASLSNGTSEPIIRLASNDWQTAGSEAATANPSQVDRLISVDIDNDGFLDLVGVGENTRAWKGSGSGEFEGSSDAFGLPAARSAVAIDFDIEGDLDVAVVGRAAGAVDLFRNTLEGPLVRVGRSAFPRLEIGEGFDIASSDIDRDGDLDLVVGHRSGLVWLDNLRQGRFRDRTFEAGLASIEGAVSTVVSADLDNDGQPDLLTGGDDLKILGNTGGAFQPWPPNTFPRLSRVTDLIAFDADNDGRLDFAALDQSGLTIARQTDGKTFSSTTIEVPASSSLTTTDLDSDGDLDLLLGTDRGVQLVRNNGGNSNSWLAVNLRGLTKGNSKNNTYGVGSLVEIRDGDGYQFREGTSQPLHFGLGSNEHAGVLRVVWTNGVPQNRIELAGNQEIVEEQLLKGSCPFLYAWNGDGFQFVTDLLWGAPLGLPVAAGVWAPSRPDDLVRIDGLVADRGQLRLRITEELWEAAFLDSLRVWVVDHPRDVEVASNLRILTDPAELGPLKVLGSEHVRPATSVLDGRSIDVTEVVAQRDERYADGYRASEYQGIAREPWTFTIDLGERPACAPRLHLDGWIFPSDASINLAVDQRQDIEVHPTRLEVETDDGWQTLLSDFGFPAGKTKTMVVDLPELPANTFGRLRIVTTQWLHWDRVAWTCARADDSAQIVARLAPTAADLRQRGFSSPQRTSPNGPHIFAYDEVSQRSPWIAFPGHYTRYGDVVELLDIADDRSVILAPGDEVAVEFDASHLPDPAEGFRRTYFLESIGWDKDADRNTYAGQQLEPLPFRAMSGYPFAEGESFPETELLRQYRDEWLTRVVTDD